MSKPRIMVVTKFAPGGIGVEPYYAGEWRDGFELSIALARAGCQVVMATPAILPAHGDSVLSEILPVANQEDVRLRFGTFAMNAHTPALATIGHTVNWLSAYRELRPDLVVFLQLRLDPGLLVPEVAKRALAGVYYVEEHFSHQPRTIPERNNLSDLSPEVSRSLQLLDRVAGLILNLTTRFLNRRHIHRNYMGVGLLSPVSDSEASSLSGCRVIEMYKGVLTDIPQMAPATSNGLDAIFCGNIHAVKGIFDLVEAMKSLPQTVRLGIIGTGKTEDVMRLRSLVRLMPNIEVLGAVGFLHKYAWLKGARVLVLPSYRDFYPSVILEALACGLPVITTKSITSPVVDGQNGLLVDAGRPDQLARAINAATTDTTLHERLARGAAETALELSWDTAVRNIMALIPGDSEQ